ncbi:protein of unknown function (plasmid) [Pseudorhizobium banfieldiae]|uniref:Uncharacterized protein n=1 Tax=Pseudorhizobium banfieldiae TaxID=1125847 RepID=L0NLN9_9HYPH|nr:protein of unknown function [Pseudorhizobium banfieldiae]
MQNTNLLHITQVILWREQTLFI